MLQAHLQPAFTCSKLTITINKFWCLYCWLWTCITPCSSVSILDFERLKAKLSLILTFQLYDLCFMLLVKKCECECFQKIFIKGYSQVKLVQSRLEWEKFCKSTILFMALVFIFLFNFFSLYHFYININH